MSQYIVQWSERMNPDDWTPAPRGTIDFTEPVAAVAEHDDGWLVTLVSGRQFVVSLKR